FVRLNAIPRTFWTMTTQIIMVLTYLLYASSLNGTLYAATALLGTCYGVQIAIMISTSSELFGLKNFGIIFNFMQLGNPLGALLFSGTILSLILTLRIRPVYQMLYADGSFRLPQRSSGEWSIKEIGFRSRIVITWARTHPMLATDIISSGDLPNLALTYTSFSSSAANSSYNSSHAPVSIN
nr:protein nuclear fusion defective 4-like [Tanacetum cinerariifolium]